MSKNKFFKKLLVAGLCALTATATVGTVVTVAGCKKEDEQKEQTQEYTVTFDLDGGTWSNANSVKVKDGEKVNKPSNPTKTGHTFVKWVDKSDNTEYNFDTVVDGDLTLKAIWQVSQGGDVTTKYTVTINLDGGTWGDNSLEIEVEKDGTLGDALADVTALPTKTGATFAGWLIEKDGAWVDYETDTPVTANITIKASWTAAHQHDWATEWTKDVNGHHKKATCNVSGEGCDVAKSEEGPHKDADKDLVCDDCGYTEANLPAGYTSVLATEGATTVLKDTFIVAGKLPEFSDWGTAGVYGLADTGADTAANYVEVAGGKVVQVSPGKDKGGKNLGTIVDFGGAKSGVVKGYLEFKASLLGSKWNIVQFYDGAAPKDDNIVFTLRVGEDKETLYYATEKLSSGNGTACDANFKLSPEKDYALEYEFDLSNGTVTVKIGLTTAESLTTILDGKSIGVSSLTGLRLVSGDSGNRLITVDNVAVVNIPASLDVYQTATKAKVTKVNNDLGSTWTSANTATALAAAKTTAEGAIDGATDNAGVDAAYSAYETAVIAALKGEYEARLDTNYPAGSYTTNKSDYDAAIAAAKTAINGVTKINGFDSVYAEHKLVLDAIEDDTAAATADVTVSLKDDEGNVIGTLTVKAGVTITEDALKAKFTVPSGKVFGGFYQEAGLTNAYTVPIDTSAITTDTTLEVYVKFDNKAQGAGHYIINVVNKSPSTASGDELWPDSSVTYVNKDGGNTSANASDFKFDGNTAAVTIVLKVTAGQTITVKVSGFTGSNGNATDVKCTATNATLTSGSDTVEFSATSTVTAQDDGTMVYTVDEGKDTVTLVFKRNIGKTSRVTEFDITVA